MHTLLGLQICPDLRLSNLAIDSSVLPAKGHLSHVHQEICTTFIPIVMPFKPSHDCRFVQNDAAGCEELDGDSGQILL